MRPHRDERFAFGVRYHAQRVARLCVVVFGRAGMTYLVASLLLLLLLSERIRCGYARITWRSICLYSRETQIILPTAIVSTCVRTVQNVKGSRLPNLYAFLRWMARRVWQASQSSSKPPLPRSIPSASTTKITCPERRARPVHAPPPAVKPWCVPDQLRLLRAGLWAEWVTTSSCGSSPRHNNGSDESESIEVIR